MKGSLLALLGLLLVPGLLFSQEEKIINYDVQLEVNRDRSVLVTEFLQVYAAGNLIKRGLTRNLPRQRSLGGHTVSMPYEILEITKNGQTEPYHTENSGGDMVIYIGSRDILLDPGIYEYKITYRVRNQIGFFDEYDEIYWNAIGNDVQFTIENASCRVRLPAGAQIVQDAAYTGYAGEAGTDFSRSNEGQVLDYRTTRPLRPNEGFSVAVGFAKGVVDEPSFIRKFGTLIVILLGLLFLIPYYIYTWWKYGRDPVTPPSYPIFHAPDQLSAASLNHILKGRYSNKSFTASIIHLAIKGFLRIESVTKKGFLSNSTHYDLIKIRSGDDSLPLEERIILDQLFREGDRVHIEGEYDPVVEKTYQAHNTNLTHQHRAFLQEGHNAQFLVWPILITLAIGGLAVYLLVGSPYASGINLVTLATFAPFALVTLFLYGYLIKKPTVEKLDLRSRINGFKMYLEMAEKDRLRLLNPPDMTPEHFEEVLPYAFALGVEHEWSDKFKKILEQAQYQPQWNNSPNMIYFSDHFGRNFESDLSGASTRPSESGSGSGGGGFSGGGGGGGGVGGW